jgi:hypothetical protein
MSYTCPEVKRSGPWCIRGPLDVLRLPRGGPTGPCGALCCIKRTFRCLILAQRANEGTLEKKNMKVANCGAT